MADNLQKRPSKGILKNSSSFDKQDSRSSNSFVRRKSKETKWDEMNIIATLHPPDKDYGHMKIDEPKTPYNYEDLGENLDELDASELAEKIRIGTAQPPRVMQSNSDDDDDDDEDEMISPEERAKKKDFESKRKKHYNEFYAVKLARKLLEEEEDEDEENDNDGESRLGSGSSTTHDLHQQNTNVNENSNHSLPQ